MHKLEEDLGVILFRREGRISVLTAAGKVLLEQGRELLIAAEQLVETAEGRNMVGGAAARTEATPSARGARHGAAVLSATVLSAVLLAAAALL